MTVHLYGHNPPPVMTRNERAVLEVMDSEYRPAGIFQKQLPNISKDSIAVALVRLRNRGLIESTKELCSVQLWRRVTDAPAASPIDALEYAS